MFTAISEAPLAWQELLLMPRGVCALQPPPTLCPRTASHCLTSSPKEHHPSLFPLVLFVAQCLIYCSLTPTLNTSYKFPHVLFPYSAPHLGV